MRTASRPGACTKIGCHCGHTIFDSTDVLPNKAHLIPDQGWNAMWDALEEQVVNAVAAGTITTDDASWKARVIVRDAGKRLMYQCAACGRLYIDDRRGTLQCYVPATNGTDREVLRGRNPVA